MKTCKLTLKLLLPYIREVTDFMAIKSDSNCQARYTHLAKEVMVQHLKRESGVLKAYCHPHQLHTSGISKKGAKTKCGQSYS